MKKINKCILLITVILLSVLFMPFSVKAIDEPLGSTGANPIMTIMYARNDETNNKKGIAIYKYIDSTIKIEDVDGNEISNPISGLIVTFDESEECFIMTLEDGADINLEAYFTNEEYYSMIYSPCNLEIVGNGTLTLTALSKPEMLSGSVINAYIYVKGDVYIGDESTYPTINFKSNLNPSDENPYLELEGIMGNKFYVQNAKIYAELKNFIFVNVPLEDENVPDNAQGGISNMLTIDNSIIKGKYAKLNEHDVASLCGILYIQPMHEGGLTTYREGNVVITNNSELTYSCDAENLVNMDGGLYAINLYDESGIVIEDSKVSFESNSNLNFCNALKMQIISHEPSIYLTSIKLNQEKETDYPLIKTNVFELFDSKFKFSTKKGPIFDLNIQSTIEEGGMQALTGSLSLQSRRRNPHVIRPENVYSYIYIFESDENIDGAMKIEEGTVFPFITPTPVNSPLLEDVPIRTSSSKYDWVHIETCGRTYPIKDSGKRSEYLESDKRDGKTFHVFDFNVYEDQDTKLEASEYFIFKKEPINNSNESKHIVLNTGIN